MRRVLDDARKASSPAVAVSAKTCGLSNERNRRGQARVRRPVARLGEVMRFVDDDERRNASSAQRVAMELKKLRRRQHDVPRAVAQGGKEIGAFARVDRAVGAKEAQAERVERYARIASY